MCNRNRWLAAILTIAIALGDCGGITAFAAEDAVHTENTVSENTVISDEAPTGEDLVMEDTEDDDPSSDGEPEINGEDDELLNIPTQDDEPEINLPALHIGQIPENGLLPDTDDDTFIYDLPVSFASSKNLILFTDYDIEAAPETEETGTLEWSILRGEKGIAPGSTNLLDESDDWNDFETVHYSPFFTMEKITDQDSDYYQMMLLVPGENAVNISEHTEPEKASEQYDYYIRAAYYPRVDTGKAKDFYAAATIPFISQNDSDQMREDDGPIPNDAADTEQAPADAAQEESSVSENSADAVDEPIGDDSIEDDALPADENTVDDTAKTLSTLSENSMAEDVSPTPGEELPEAETPEVTSLTLSETETLTMQPKEPGSTRQITATVTVDPLNAAAPPLLWESSDKTVATVTAGENGTATITALAEGYAKITASCGGKTASVTVDVVPDTANPGDKLLDLSNEIRVAGFEKESDSLVYTGQKITQNIRVYYKETLLTEKTDYTLSYKNNVNAARWNAVKAPSVTINLRGQYQGSVTLYYTIKPLDINKIDSYTASEADGAKTPGYEQTVNYGKNLNIPAPVLNFGKKKLAAKKDFVCDYDLLTTELGGKDYKKGDSYVDGKVYHYTVNGVGNYTGTFRMQLVVLRDKKQNFSTAAVKLDKSRYDYCGKPLTTADVKIETLKISGQILEPSLYEYEVCADTPDGAYLNVFPSETGRNAGYRGCKKVTLKLTGDRKIKDAVYGENWKDEIIFSQQTVDKTGGMFQEKTKLLQFGSDPLVEGIDYTIKYSNAKKAGNVTVTFKGLGRYTGSVSKRYKIAPNSNSRNLTIVWGKNVKKEGAALKIPYQKNGASPEFYIRDQDYAVLNSKTDYSVKLKDNKTPGKDMTCTITGKGNYKGYENTITLTVTKRDISDDITLSVSDKPYDSKPNKWKSPVTVTDANGKKLTAGTDYSKEIVYTYDGMDPADANAVPPVGTSVTVKITGTGNYEGTLTQQNAYRIYDKAKDIGKLKIVIDPQIYTGEEITLKKSDIHIYATAADQKAKKELEGKDSCFEIVESSYKNNIKTGTAKVNLHGIGEYGGVKTYSFKIQKKKYQINHVKGITLDKPSLSLPLAEQDEKKRTLTATITSENNEQIANPTVIWTSSNSSIASVEEKPDSAVIGSADGKRTVSVSAVLTLKKGGSVTITAASQDGNRKVTCKVSIIDAPVLLEAGQAVQAEVNQTYQLHMVFTETQNPAKLSWISNNPDAVSVSKNEEGALLTMHKAGVAVIEAVYTSGNGKFTQQCYALAIDPNEKSPEGNVLTYTQKPGCADDTPYINNLLREWEWNPSRYECMYLPAGIYHIDAAGGDDDVLGNYKFGGIILTSNQKLIMSPSALLVTLGNNLENSQVIWAFDSDNVTISGGQIIGERREHKGSRGEWGHGIKISSCTNVTIENVDVSQCWGDGIYLGFNDGSEIYTSDVTITNCNLHHNRRNNLSITDASNVTVKHCQFNYANGTAPQYGIDIEPNKNRICSNVTITDSTFKGNAVGTIQILGQLNAHVKDVTIENCTGDKEPVIWQGFGGSVSGVTQKGNKW